MPKLRFQGIVTTGNASFDTNIADLHLVAGEGGPVLVSVTGGAGGLASFTLAQGALPTVTALRGADADALTGLGPRIVDYRGDLLVAGLSRGAVDVVGFMSGDRLTWPDQRDTGGTADWATAAQVGDNTLALAESDGSGFSVHAVLNSGALAHVRTVTDQGDSHAADISAMVGVTLGSRDFLLVASASEQGLSSYEVSGSVVSLRDTSGPAEGLGLMVPRALELVTLAGQTHVLVASAPGNGGQVGAISVMRFGTGGQLTPTDHVMDTRDTRFAQIQDIATADYNGVTLVAAGGGDDGVSLMALLPDGRLVHLDAFADTNAAGLDGVTSLEMAVLGTQLQVFAASGGDRGLTLLTADLSTLGVAQGAADGASLTGTARDDILADGAGAETLDGGAGADLFVIAADGDDGDRILDFDPAQDRLDLSSWPLLYDASTLDIRATANGARIEGRGQVLVLQGLNGQSLDPEAVRAAIVIDMNRAFVPPSVLATGDPSAEALEGSWGNDTLSGGGGDDTLTPLGGDDTIRGGSGSDRVVFRLNSDEIQSLSISGDSVTLVSGEGTDRIESVEEFQFLDTTLTLAQLEALQSPTVLTGGEGNDRLTSVDGRDLLDGGAGNDTLNAGAGNDTLLGRNGDDFLNAGSGDDRITPGTGDDTVLGGAGDDRMILALASGAVRLVDSEGDSVTLQSAEGTDVISGVEWFQFADGTRSLDQLQDLTGPPMIEGSDDGDVLRVSSGNARIMGHGGDDALNASDGEDYLSGGDGRDTIQAGRGADTVTGDAGDDDIWGDGGNDTILGGDGADSLRGGRESDRIEGGAGNDFLRGQSDADTLYGGAGDDNIKGGGGNDAHYGEDGDDFVLGGTRRDYIDGGTGNDVLSGNSFDDTLIGGDGHDLLRAGGDDDRLEGGSGNDTLKGGSGADVFVFAKGCDIDVITDFDIAGDRIELKAGLTGGINDADTVAGLFARVTSDGVLLDFGGGDSILLQGLSDTTGLGGAIDIA